VSVPCSLSLKAFTYAHKKAKALLVKSFGSKTFVLDIIPLFKTLSSKKALFSKLFLCDNINMSDTELAVDFWARIKALIKANNTTQEGLAKSADLNFSNLKQQIFYNRLPDVAQATRIAQSLNTTVEYLVTGTSSAPKPDTSALLATLEQAIKQVKEL